MLVYQRVNGGSSSKQCFIKWAMSFITWQVDANLQEVQNRISDSAARNAGTFPGGYTHWVCLEIGENWGISLILLFEKRKR
jgi:hypothetical protein